MKAILYVLAHRSGDIETFQIGRIPQSSDEKLLRDYAPENLRGHAQRQFKNLLEDHYSLSNWHIVEN